MKCPHCSVAINFDDYDYFTVESQNNDEQGKAYYVSGNTCPDCGKVIIVLQIGKYVVKDGVGCLENVDSKTIIFPKHYTRAVEPEVPDRYQQDFKEACAVIAMSPKASAALSRRILQHVLREIFKIKKPNLADEIEEFINRKDVPTYLSEAVDAVRNVGNFAAHPLKDTHTGEIVDVEPGEAEWLLDVIESMFDFAFVQPRRLAERQKRLNQKLQAMGKPPMKAK